MHYVFDSSVCPCVCASRDCRFAHCSRQQEALYRRTGLLPVSAQKKQALDVALTRALWRGETPVCIDFLKAAGCR